MSEAEKPHSNLDTGFRVNLDEQYDEAIYDNEES